MTARITQKIDLLSRRWLIGDRIAELLLVESRNQYALAEARNEDPSPYDIRVFRERTNPWDLFVLPDEQEDISSDLRPIVNIWFDNRTTERAASNPISRTKVTGVYNIDCYACGVSRETLCGHEPGDLRASRVADQTIELVRGILTAGTYTYLGLPRRAEQYVWGVHAETITMYQPQIENRHVQSIHAGRLTFHVEFNEESLEAEPAILEGVSVRIDNASGEFLFETKYESGTSGSDS